MAASWKSRQKIALPIGKKNLLKLKKLGRSEINQQHLSTLKYPPFAKKPRYTVRGTPRELSSDFAAVLGSMMAKYNHAMRARTWRQSSCSRTLSRLRRVSVST